LLGQLPQMRFSGVHADQSQFIAAASESWRLGEIRALLSPIQDGQFATGHFSAYPALLELLDELNFARLFVVRDLRDVVVSHAHYVTGQRSHTYFKRYAEKFRSTDERLMASITGSDADEHDPALESIGARARAYRPWLDDPNCLVVRFEALVGAQGGSTEELQEATVSAIAQQVGRPLDAETLLRVCRNVWSPSSSTFRSGQVGEWRRHFKSEHVRAFK